MVRVLETNRDHVSVKGTHVAGGEGEGGGGGLRAGGAAGGSVELIDRRDSAAVDDPGVANVRRISRYLRLFDSSGCSISSAIAMSILRNPLPAVFDAAISAFCFWTSFASAALARSDVMPLQVSLAENAADNSLDDLALGATAKGTRAPAGRLNFIFSRLAPGRPADRG